MKNTKGFTLVELLAVIVIMGILMMVAIPAVSRTIENTRKDSFVNTAKNYANAALTQWTADGFSCGGITSSAVDTGKGDTYRGVKLSSMADLNKDNSDVDRIINFNTNQRYDLVNEDIKKESDTTDDAYRTKLNTFLNKANSKEIKNLCSTLRFVYFY